MSRSGYSDDCENYNLWRGVVSNAIGGKRGQAFLRALAEALDAMPEKVLIAGELVTEKGECCAIGAVCKARSLDVSNVDYEDPDRVAKLIDVAPAMAAEIAFMNDEYGKENELPSERWTRMRKWVSDKLRTEP